MNSIIVYASKYGSTKRYAEGLSNRIGINAISYKDIKNYRDYDLVIYLGRMCAGHMPGLSKVMKKTSVDANVIIVGVGIAKADSPNNIKVVNEQLEDYMRGRDPAKVSTYHLRGAIDYATMKGFDKFGMKMMYKMISRMKEVDEDCQAVLDTYGKTVDFVDLDTLEPIVDKYNELTK